MHHHGFDTDLYLSLQIKQIREMLDRPGDKVYLEIGGKLIQDRHAARVLPGYREDARFEVVKALSTFGDAILVVSAKDILRGRVRGDFRTTYDQETLRTIRELRDRDFPIRHVAITLLEKNAETPPEIAALEDALRKEDITVHRFFFSDSYQSGLLSLDDLAANPYVESPSRFVFVVSPGGGSGKFGICLNQLYHEMKRGRAPQYFSLGAFPVYGLPANHPLNLAYMAAMADVKDALKEDPRAPGSLLTEREIVNHELLRQLAGAFEVEGRYLREIPSATAMCVSALAQGITDEEVVQKEAAAEVARRYMRYKFEVERGEEQPETLERVRKILTML